MRQLIVASSFATIDTCSVKNVYLKNLWLERHKNFSSNKDVKFYMRQLIVTSSFVTIDTCSVKNVNLQNLLLVTHKNFVL